MSDQNPHLRPSGASVADSEKTAAVSKTPSVVMDYDKADTAAPSTANSARAPSAEHADPQTAQRNSHSKEDGHVDEVDAGIEVEDPEHEYPKAWRLAVITIALCLSVFCMALVRSTP